MIASDYGIIPLEVGYNAIAFMGNFVRRAGKMSLKLTKDNLVLTLIDAAEPHNSIEMIVPRPSEIPEVIACIESDEVNLIGTDHVFFATSYARGKDRNEVALLVSYDSMGIYSQVSPNNSGLQNSGNLNSYPSPDWNTNAILSGSIRSKITFNSTEDYSTEVAAMLEFPSITKARSLLGKAGRSKPQGDLILFFGKDNCLAQGVNAAGEETLSLQNAATKRTLGSYKGTENSQVYKMTYKYTDVFDKFLTTKQSRRPPINLRYGVDANGFQVIEADYDADARDTGDKKMTLRFVNRKVVAEVIESLPEHSFALVNLSGRSPIPVEVEEVSPVVQEVIEQPEQSSVEAPEAWREAYVRQEQSRGRSPDGGTITDYFNAYCMSQLQQGIHITPEEFDLYNALK